MRARDPRLRSAKKRDICVSYIEGHKSNRGWQRRGGRKAVIATLVVFLLLRLSKINSPRRPAHSEASQ